jgi:hypothetical protein
MQIHISRFVYFSEINGGCGGLAFGWGDHVFPTRCMGCIATKAASNSTSRLADSYKQGLSDCSGFSAKAAFIGCFVFGE